MWKVSDFVYKEYLKDHMIDNYIASEDQLEALSMIETIMKKHMAIWNRKLALLKIIQY